MTLRTAFAYSINTVAARIGEQVGYDTISSMARRFGITTPVGTEPSMVLGSYDVHLLDMTRAFAAVAADGKAVTPYGITKVETDEGDVLYTHEQDEPRTLVADYVAAQMVDLLQTAVATGSGRAAQIGRPVAGKTGTTRRPTRMAGSSAFPPVSLPAPACGWAATMPARSQACRAVALRPRHSRRS